MGWPVCNTTLEDMQLSETPVWNNFTFHELGLGLSGIFAAIAVVISFVLIHLHATHYLRPSEQRHIIRILFMVPIYATVSFLSILYYRHSVYFEVLRDCYEAFAIASFFSLLCSYIADDLHHQKQYFRTIQAKPWIWPMRWLQRCFGGETGCLRTPRSGLTWFNVVWVAIFQYCFIRVAMTIVAVVTQVFDRYCLESLNPAFSHIWVMLIEAVAVSIAMYCLIQFYVQVKGDIAQHNPLQKVIAIKLVIFLSFWQTIVISFLTSSGAIKPNDEFRTPDIKIGIPAMLLCIEMALFSIFHIFAFSWRPYVIGGATFQNQLEADDKPTPSDYQGGFLGMKAIVDAFNPWDLLKAVGRAAKWLFRDRRNRHDDSSYKHTQFDNTHQLASTDAASKTVINSSTTHKTNLHPGVNSDEGQTLLSAPAPMAGYASSERDQYSQHPSPYQQSESVYYTAGDIGVAQTTSDRSRFYVPPRTNYEPGHLYDDSSSISSGTRYEAARPKDPRQAQP